MDEGRSKARCTNCRTDAEVPASFTNGDHIRCGVCGTEHTVFRGRGKSLALRGAEGPRGGALGRRRALLPFALEGLVAGMLYLAWETAMTGNPLTGARLGEGAAVAMACGLYRARFSRTRPAQERGNG
jgi:hypothetical protein